MRKRLMLLALTSLLALALIGAVAAQDDDNEEPHVKVSDQVVNDGTVWIEEVHSHGPGFVVIHIQKDGSVGPVIGFRWINDGESYNVKVPIDATMATGTMYAMLHEDTGVVGKYEFGTVDGADNPVSGDNTNPSFKAEILRAYDQFIADNVVKVASVTTNQDGFVVIHDGDQSNVGAVLGYTPVKAGTTTDVSVTLEKAPTSNFVWPMLHVDDGVAGTYEFGTVEGADSPVVINGVVSTFPIVVNAPSMRVNSQIVKADNMIWAESVSSSGPGWLVIYADNAGAPGEVIGYAPVVDGGNWNVGVTVDPAKLTPTVFPMLHADTGVAGTYEFGEVEGEDLPQMGSNGKPLFFPIMVQPGIVYNGTLADGVLTVESALIDKQGWLVIHADAGGKPGPVLGFTPLVPGATSKVAVTLASEGMTDTVYPMLHVDDGVMGEYEFGKVEGADAPVTVGGNVVTGPLTPAK